MMSEFVSGNIGRDEITAFTARQLDSLGDEAISQLLKEHWGEVRPTAAERANRILELQEMLRQPGENEVNLAAGKELFEQQCASCHQLFGEGTNVGPDLSGAQRSNLAYMLENIVDPNAAVSRDYQMEIVSTLDGRVINGLVISEADGLLELKTLDDRLVLPLEEVEMRRTSSLSLMPDGLLDPLSDQQIRDLLGFLANPADSPHVDGRH